MSTGPLVQFDPWQIQFIRTTGQMIVNDAGGVYLVDENGVATRTSTGDLLASGRTTTSCAKCDEHAALACTSASTRRPASATSSTSAVLDQYRPWADLSSLSLSPDGTAVTYFDWQNGGSTPVRRLIDLTTVPRRSRWGRPISSTTNRPGPPTARACSCCPAAAPCSTTVPPANKSRWRRRRTRRHRGRGHEPDHRVISG